MTWSSGGVVMVDRGKPTSLMMTTAGRRLLRYLGHYSALLLSLTTMWAILGGSGAISAVAVVTSASADEVLDVPSEYTVLQGSIDVNYNITRFASPSSSSPSLMPINANLHNRKGGPESGFAGTNSSAVSSNNDKTSAGKFSLQLLELVSNNAELLVTEMPLYPETPVGTAVFPCGTISHAGRYVFKLVRRQQQQQQQQQWPNVIDKGPKEVYRTRLMTALWPHISFRLPSLVDSYSTGANVTVALTRTQCEPFSAFRLRSEFRIRALATNRTSARVDVTSVFKSVERVVYVPCHAFGHAGLYRAEIWMVTPTGSETLAAKSQDMEISWGKGFKLKLFSTSAFPCSGAGVLLAYETPSCSIEDHHISNNDEVVIGSRLLYVDNRIRVYGRVKVANVSAAMAPTRLVYIGEKNVRGVPGGSVAFDCPWFSEDFVEYCFVITNVDEQGAVADVVKQCIPTYPPAVIRHGGWSPWQPWSECDAKCGYGHRSRIRLCDSPFPTYGGRYCEGSPLEDEVCERSPACLLPFEKPGSPRTITPFAECQCGCNVSLVGDGGGIDLFANIRNCIDSELIWLIETKAGSKLVATLKFLQLDEPVQVLALRDGAGMKDELLTKASLVVHPVTFESTSRFLLFRIDTKYRRPFFAFAGFLARVRSLAVVQVSTTEDSSAYSSWPQPGSWPHLVFHFVVTHQAQLVILATLALVCCAVTSMASYAAAVAKCCPNYHQRKFSEISFSSSVRRESLRPLRDGEDDEEDEDVDDEEGYSKIKNGRRKGRRRRDEEDGRLLRVPGTNGHQTELSTHIYHEIGGRDRNSNGTESSCLPRLLLRKTFFRNGINARNNNKGTRLRESLSLMDYEAIFGSSSHHHHQRCTKVHSSAADWINCPICSTRQQHSLPGSPCVARKGVLSHGNCKHNNGSSSKGNNRRCCSNKGFSWPPGLRMRGSNQLGGRKSSSVQCIDVEERVDLSAFREIFTSRLAICSSSSGVQKLEPMKGLTRSETRDANVSTHHEAEEPHAQDFNSPAFSGRITSAEVEALRADSASSLAGSCNQGEELEMDYYDYDVFNACAVPGSMFSDASVLDWLPSFADVDGEGPDFLGATPSSLALNDATPTNEAYPMGVLNDLAASVTNPSKEPFADCGKGSAINSSSDSEDGEIGVSNGLLSRFKILNSEPPIAFVDEEDIMAEDGL